MKLTRSKIIPASYLVLIKNNKILLSRRKNTGFQDGKYTLVSGHIKASESFTEATIRETKEEANIILKPADLKVVYVMNRFEKSNPPELRNRLDVFFLAKKWQGEIKNMEPKKCDDLSWFPLNKLPKNTIPYIKHTLKNIKHKKFYSEYGFN